jgi:hypothetical protein
MVCRTGAKSCTERCRPGIGSPQRSPAGCGLRQGAVFGLALDVVEFLGRTLRRWKSAFPGRRPMASRQPLGYCCTAESAKSWTAITSTPMYGRPRYGRPRLPQAESSRPEPTACTPCGISTSPYCWMRARASRRSRSISGTATPASRCGPTPTCCRPASSEQGRPSTAPHGSGATADGLPTAQERD